MRTIVQPLIVLLLISAGSVTVAFLLGGYWVIVGVLAAQLGFWFASRRRSVQWRSSCLLVMYVAIAAAGILLGLTAALLLVGTVAALAAWDVLNFGETLKSARGPEDIRLLSRSHVGSLILALTFGTLLSFTGLTLDLDLPFPITAMLALALVVGLAGAARYTGSIDG